MKRANLLLAASIAVGVAFLCNLGVWQMKRLHWKEALIARVETGLTRPPVSLGEVEAALARGEDIEYRPVHVSGRFDHSAESHYFATYKGKPGYFVYTPLHIADGRTLFVNRGYVPMERKDPSTRPEGQAGGVVNIAGLARSAPKQKPNSFVPENDMSGNIFYWKSLDQMTARVPDLSQGKVVPFFVDAGPEPEPVVGAPLGGVTRITFPNSHLQYAVTWFGLAAALMAVGGTFLWRRRKVRATP